MFFYSCCAVFILLIPLLSRIISYVYVTCCPYLRQCSFFSRYLFVFERKIHFYPEKHHFKILVLLYFQWQSCRLSHLSAKFTSSLECSTWMVTIVVKDCGLMPQYVSVECFSLNKQCYVGSITMQIPLFFQVKWLGAEFLALKQWLRSQKYRTVITCGVKRSYSQRTVKSTKEILNICGLLRTLEKMLLPLWRIILSGNYLLSLCVMWS